MRYSWGVQPTSRLKYLQKKLALGKWSASVISAICRLLWRNFTFAAVITALSILPLQ